MFWPFSIYNLLYPKEKYVWARVRILHETDKAILVDNGMKIWISKSQIYGIKLRNNFFEIYVRESGVDSDLPPLIVPLVKLESTE